MDEAEQIAAPDALWLAALARDRARAAARLADMLPGRGGFAGCGLGRRNRTGSVWEAVGSDPGCCR